MVAGFGIGQFIDMFGTHDRQMAFSWVFAVGTLFGLAGFLVLRRAPYPAMPPTQGQAYDFTRVLRPFADSNFRRAALLSSAANRSATAAARWRCSMPVSR